MLYEDFFQSSASVPSWSTQPPGLHEEVDRGYQDRPMMLLLQSKQLLHSDLQPFQNEESEMAAQDLFATDWNLHAESQLKTSNLGNPDHLQL